MLQSDEVTIFGEQIHHHEDTVVGMRVRQAFDEIE
jgi:hypothetical protein